MIFMLFAFSSFARLPYIRSLTIFTDNPVHKVSGTVWHGILTLIDLIFY